MTIVSISLNDEILSELDKLQSTMGFSGRSEAIRAGIRSFVSDEKQNSNLSGNIHAILLVVHNDEFDQLLNTYYDNRIEDEHTRTGGGDVKYGYAGCGLLLTLYHNCPNNSIYLLWGQTEKTKQYSGLEAVFPRISRHSEER